MAEAEAAVKQASANMAAAQTEFGKAAEQGNAQAAAALRAYQAELQSAQSALNSFAGAEQRETVALRENISARMAASAELRVLEGNFMGSTRAAGAFLSTLPGIGAAMQVAFPVFGAVALGSVLVDVGLKAYNFYQDVVNLKSAMKDLDSLDLSVSSTVKRLGDETEQSTIRFIELTQGVAAAKLAQMDYMSSKPIDLSDMFNQEGIRKLPDRVKAGFENAFKVIDPSQLDSKISSIKGKMAELQDVIANPMAHRSMTGVSHSGPIYTLPDEAEATAQLRLAQDIDKRLEAEAAEHAAKMKELSAEVGKADDQDAGKAFRSAAEAAGIAAKNAREIVSLYTEIDNQVFRLAQEQNEINTRQVEYWAALQKAQDRATDPAIMEGLERSSKDQLETLKEQTEQYRLQADAKIRAASESYRGVEQSTSAAVAGGTMNPSQRIQLLQQAAAQENAAQQDAIQKKIALDAGYTDKLQADTDQQTQMSQAYFQKQVQLAQQSTALMLAPYKTFFSEVSGQFNTFIDSQLQGTQRLGAAFLKLGDSIAMDMINSTLKWGEKLLQQEVMSVVQHEQSAAAYRTIDAASKATSLATTATENTALVTSNAAVAAAGASAATAAIPVVGPALAPAAAATTFTDTMAYASLASFDEGTSFIPRDGMAMLHEGEAVLPPPQTDELRAALGSRGRNGGGTVINNHYSPQISAIDGPSVAGALQTHGQAFMREQYRQLRL
jgi:hypothetical protein